MRRTVFFLYSILLAICVKSQELKVISFNADETDISAVKFKVLDANEEPCALVKIGLVLPDVTFEGDIIKSEYKEGEYWVYLIDGANWLNVKSKRYLPLRYEFPEVKKLTTYIMQIEKPQIAYDGPTGTVIIKSNIQEAEVYVDGEKLSSIIPYTYKGPEGKHIVEIKAAGYNDEKMTIEVKLNQKLQQYISMKAEGSFQFDGVSYEMVNVDGTASFLMGNAESIEKTYRYEGLRSFKIGKTEVTQALWKAIMNSNPSTHIGENLPVENVSWEDCQEFIKQLNERCETHFRLPTEAEWEFAARSRGFNKAEDFAGSKNVSDVANITGQTIDVASKQPNALGIYDMSGNVAEWCQDWWESYTSKVQNNSRKKTFFFKIVRGGSYADGAKSNQDKLKCYYRGKQKPDNANPTIGFRLAQDN